MAMVSICIPAYRQPEMLARCLRSIYSQGFRDFEVVITDDTEDDSVGAVARTFLDKGNLRYFRNDSRKGSPENWNEAMRRASGNYLMVMHHDDWFYDDKALGVLVDRILGGSFDLVFGKSLNIDSNSVIVSTNDPSEIRVRCLKKDIRSLFYGNFIGAPSAVLFKRKNLYFDPRLKWLVDIDFYLRLLKGGSLEYASEALVSIGLDSSRMTQSCYGNSDVEIPENILVYRGIGHSLRELLPDFLHFRDLFTRLGLGIKDLWRFDSSARVRFFFCLYLFLSCLRTAAKRIVRTVHPRE